MPQVAITIDGRNYLMACDDGEEAHLQALATRLEHKIAEMRVRFGQIGDTRILVMAALTITDEAHAAEQEVQRFRNASGVSPEAQASRADPASDAIATTLDELARRIAQAAAAIGSD